MIWLYVAIGACLFIAGLFGIRAYRVPYSDAVIGAFWFVGMAVVIGVIVLAVSVTARHDETICARQAVDLERDTRFVRYSSFSWDCITPSEDGWVSIDRIIKAEGSE